MARRRVVQTADSRSITPRPESRPVTFSINLPSLPDEPVVEIQSLLFEILDLVQTYYAHRIKHYLENYSFDNITQSDNTHTPTDDPPF